MSDPVERLETLPRFRGWMEKLEREMTVDPEMGDRALGPTGDPYQTVCWDLKGKCIKPEGAEAAAFQTIPLAWALWVAAFERYRSIRGGKTLYWRQKPELIQSESSGWIVYARLFIPLE